MNRIENSFSISYKSAVNGPHSPAGSNPTKFTTEFSFLKLGSERSLVSHTLNFLGHSLRCAIHITGHHQQLDTSRDTTA